MSNPRDLTRANVTLASRIMLPTHVAFSALLGAAWTWQADERTAVPSLYALRDVWPIQATGGVLVGLGVIGLGALLAGRRTPAAIILAGAAVAYLLLAVAIAASLTSTTLASLSAPLWPAYIAVAHLATVASLAADEWTDIDRRNR